MASVTFPRSEAVACFGWLRGGAGGASAGVAVRRTIGLLAAPDPTVTRSDATGLPPRCMTSLCAPGETFTKRNTPAELARATVLPSRYTSARGIGRPAASRATPSTPPCADPRAWADRAGAAVDGVTRIRVETTDRSAAERAERSKSAGVGRPLATDVAPFPTS